MDIPQSHRPPDARPQAGRRTRAPWARAGHGLLRSLEWRLGLKVLGLHRAPVVAQAVPASPFTFRILDESQAIALASDRELDIRPEWSRAAHRRGDRCLAAFEGSRIVGYTWLSRQRALQDEGVELRVGDGGEYRYKTFVRPGDRGRGVMPQLYRAADAAGAVDGLSWSCLCIALHNEASIAAAAKAGARRVGFLVAWKLGSRVRLWRSPGARSAGLEPRA